MPAKKKDVGKKKKIVTKKGKGKVEVKKGASIDFSSVKKQDVYMKDPFKPELYPRVQGHESLLKAAYGQLGGRILQGGGGVVGAQGRMLTQQPPPPFIPTAFQGQGPSQSQPSMFTELFAMQRKEIEKAQKSLEIGQKEFEKQKEIQKTISKTPIKKEKVDMTAEEKKEAEENAAKLRELDRQLPQNQQMREDRLEKERIREWAKKVSDDLRYDYVNNRPENFFAIHSPSQINAFINDLKRLNTGTREEKNILAFMETLERKHPRYFKPPPAQEMQIPEPEPSSEFVLKESTPPVIVATSALPRAPFYTTPVMSLTDRELQQIFSFSRSKPASELTVQERSLIANARREDSRRKEKPIPPQETGKIATQTSTLLDVIRAQEQGQDNVVRAHSGAFTSPPSMSIDEFLEKGPPDSVVRAHSGAISSPRGGGGGGRSKEEELSMSKLPPAMKPEQQLPQQQQQQIIPYEFPGTVMETLKTEEPIDYYSPPIRAPKYNENYQYVMSPKDYQQYKDEEDLLAQRRAFYRERREWENSLIPFEEIRAGLVRKELGRVYKMPWDVAHAAQYRRPNPVEEEITYSEEPPDFYPQLEE